jgi:hypothetical protein
MRQILLIVVAVVMGSSVVGAGQKVPQALVLDEQGIVLTLPTGDEAIQVDVTVSGIACRQPILSSQRDKTRSVSSG